MSTQKSVLKSKTFWFNIAMAVSPFVPAVGEWLKGNEQVYGMVWGTLSIALRLITKDKVVLVD